MNNEITTYVPNKHLKLGIKIWPEMFRELFNNRELVYRFFLRDFSAKYKQSFLGYIWAIILPFIAIGAFVFLNRSGVMNIGKTDVPYPLFALIGLTVWQLFASGISAGTRSLVSAGGMLAKINFPRETLVFSTIGQAVFEFMIKSCMIVVCCFYFKFIPSWPSVFFPFAVLPIIFFTVGGALILSLFNCIFRDAGNMVSIVTNFLLFLTPVLYSAEGKINIFFKLNPLTSLVNGPRDLLIYGHITEPTEFFIASILSILLFLISWRVFHIAETKITERV